MEIDEKKCRKRKSKSRGSSGRGNSPSKQPSGTHFSRLASAGRIRIRLDDVKTRGKKMARAAKRADKDASSGGGAGAILETSGSPRRRSIRRKSSATSSSRGSQSNRPNSQPLRHRLRQHRPNQAPLRPASVSSAKKSKPDRKRSDFKKPDVRELTKDLVSGAQQKKLSATAAAVTAVKRRNPNDNHPVRRGKPKITDDIFQQGRQRPTGPVRTFIVFKASSNNAKRMKQKRAKHPSSRPGEKRFSAVPVHRPRFYRKSELSARKRPRPKAGLEDKIHVRSAGAGTGADLGVGAETAHGTGLAIIANIEAATSDVGADLLKARGSKMGAAPPRTPKKGSKLKSTSTSSSPTFTGAGGAAKTDVGVTFEKKAHVSGSLEQQQQQQQTHLQQVKRKSRKKKGTGVTVLQKKVVRRRRSRVYKLSQFKPSRRTNLKMTKVKKPATLPLTRRSFILGSIKPGFDNKLRARIINMQRIKKIEKDE